MMTNERLSQSIHPDLANDDGKSADGAPVFGTVSNEVIWPDSQPQQPVQQQSALNPDDYILIKRSEPLWKQIQDLQRAEPEFANAFNIAVGNKAKRKYDPEIENLREQNSILALQLQQAQLRTLTEEQVAEGMKNPQWAAMYAQVTGVDPQVAMQAQRTQADLRSTIQGILDDAISRGMPEDSAEEFIQKLQKGEYDSSGDSINAQLAAFQRDVFTSIPSAQAAMQQEPVNPPIENQEANPTSNPADNGGGSVGTNRPVTAAPPLDTAAPDISAMSSRNTAGGKTWTFEEIRTMTPDQLLNTFPNDGDFERAVASGQVTGMSDEAVEVSRANRGM